MAAGESRRSFHGTAADPVRPPSLVRFATGAPHASPAAGVSSWVARSENLVVTYSEHSPGATSRIDNCRGEHSLVVPDSETVATVSAGGAKRRVPGRSISILPPGDVEITVDSGGRVFHIVSSVFNPHAAAAAANADVYASADPYVAEYVPWPEPPGGFAPRVYPVPREPQAAGVPGWLVRCTTHMLLWTYGHVGDRILTGPEELERAGPHSHEDFEQVDVTFSGDLRFYLRSPWTLRRADWQPDREWLLESPAFVAIPPRVVHVAEGADESRVTESLALYAPPRLDWSAKPGRVMNEAEYPMPGAAVDA